MVISEGQVLSLHLARAPMILVINTLFNLTLIHMYEPRLEKTGFLLMRNREADPCLCFRYTDSTIPLHTKSENSSLLQSSVPV